MSGDSNIIDSRTHGEGSRSFLVKTLVKKQTTSLPQLNCSTSRNSMRLYVTDWDNDVVPTFDLRYAVKVNGKVYNANHSESIVGKEFTIGGHKFVVPHTSDYDVRIYVDDADIPRPFIVQLIPSPNQEYNGIYGIGESADEASYSYIDRNTDIFFCMTPEQAEVPITCVGATQVLSLVPNKTIPSDLSTYLSVGDLVSGYIDLSTTNSISLNDEITAYVETTEVGNILLSLTRGDDAVVDYKIKLTYVTAEAGFKLTVDTLLNPTATIDLHSDSIVACIKSKEAPDEVIPELPSFEFRPLPNFSHKVPKPGPVKDGINQYTLSYDTVNYTAYYKIEVEGVTLNEDFSKNLSWVDESTEDTWITDGYYNFIWAQYGSDSPPIIRMDTPNPPVAYPQLATPHLVTFTTRDTTESDFSKNDGQYLIEGNPNGEFQVITPGSFTVWMTETPYTASEIDWRDDVELYKSLTHTNGRANRAYLNTGPSGLNYDVSFNGTRYSRGNLIGTTIDDGIYTLSFNEEDGLVKVELNLTGERDESIEQTGVIVRLYPTGDYSTWAIPNDDEDSVNNTIARMTHYVDGQIHVTLAPYLLPYIEPDVFIPPTQAFQITTGFQTDTLSNLIYTKLTSVKQLVRSDWENWVTQHSPNGTETPYEPIDVQEVRVRQGLFEDTDLVFANYIKTVKQFKNDSGVWVTIPGVSLIGDGTVLYKMRTVHDLQEAGLYPYDYVSTGSTLDQWIATDGIIHSNAKLVSNYHHEDPIDDEPGVILTDYTIHSKVQTPSLGESISKYVGLGISVSGHVAVKPGTISTTTIASKSAGIYIATTITNKGEVP